MICIKISFCFCIAFLLLLLLSSSSIPVAAQSGDYTLVGFKFSDKISNAVNTTFLSPADIITDYTNGLMYVADKFKNRIVYCYLNSTDNCRQYTMTWSTYNGACTTGQCNSVGSTCCSYPYFLKDPTGVAVDTTGNMWIADRVNNRIVYCSGLLGGNCHMFTKKIAAANIPVSSPTFAPTNAPTNPVSLTTFSNPYSLVLGTSGSTKILYISDLYNNRIVACSGLSNLILEGYEGCSVYTTSYLHNSVLTSFKELRGLSLDSNYLYVCDTKNRRIVVCSGIATTANTCQTYASGYASGSAFGAPYGTARSSGYLYFADWSNNTVGYCVGDTTGACYTYTNTAAGTAFQRPSGIGITDVTFDIFVSDAANNRIVYIKSFISGPTEVPTVTPDPVPSGQPTSVPSFAPNYPSDNSSSAYLPSMAVTYAPTQRDATFAPSTPQVVTFDVYMTLSNWPYSSITNSLMDAIATLVSDITDCDTVVVTSGSTTEESDERRKLTSYSLPLIISISALSTSQNVITTAFVSNMNTAALVTTLNSACGCTAYSTVGISFISSDGYCIDATTPSRQCSFGYITLNPFLASIADYAFNDTLISGVDFGECTALTEIGIGAFMGTYLESLDLLSCDKLVSINDYAFKDSLISIVKLPQNLQAKRAKNVFSSNPLELVYCAAPYDDVLALTGVVHGFHGVVIGCFGYSSDYFLYPSMSISPSMTAVIILLVIGFIIPHALILLRTYNHFSLTFLVASTLASFDMGSDVVHFLFSYFATKPLYWASFCFALLLPLLYFIAAVVVQHSLVPHILYKWYFGRIISRRCKWNILWLWLSTERGAPLVNHKRMKFTFNNHDSIPKVIVFIVSWLILLSLQVLTLLPFFIWVLLLTPYYVLLLLTGSFLFHSKLLAHKDVWNCWVTLFTGRMNRYNKTNTFDTKLLNDAFFMQLTLTSLPLLLIKIVNYQQNYARRVFDTVAIDGVDMGYVVFYYYDYVVAEWPLISLILSSICGVIGIYRYVYLVIRHKYLIQEVPFTVTLSLDNQQKSIGIEKTDENIKYNKEAIAPYRRYWRGRVIHLQVDSSMRAVVNVATRFFMKDVALVESLDILLTLRVNFVQDLLEVVDAQLFNGETCAVDVYKLASKVLVLILQDSVDLTIHKVLLAAGVREAADLLDIDQKGISSILNALHNRNTINLVLAYLNLITYHNFTDRASVTPPVPEKYLDPIAAVDAGDIESSLAYGNIISNELTVQDGSVHDFSCNEVRPVTAAPELQAVTDPDNDTTNINPDNDDATVDAAADTAGTDEGRSKSFWSFF